MAETRQIGSLTIHFLGDSAAQLKKSFDGSFAGSRNFRNAMSETARTYKDIYVGGSLEDLQDQPGFDSARINPDSKEVRNTNAFGKGAGPETYFVVVTGKKHNLVQDGQKFVGSTDLSLVHELLHPSEIVRELTETGSVGQYSEARTQMREQTIAQELGKMQGRDFPDVIGSGVPYRVQLDSSKAQPDLAPHDDPALPVDPIKYEGDTGSPVLRALEKYRRSAASDSPAPPPLQQETPATPVFQRGSAATGIGPATASDRPESFDNRFGNWGSVPAVGFSNTSSPVLRALERYQRSALPDGASSSSGQAAGPATNLPGEESAFGDRSGNAPNAPRPDNYPPRRVSSAFPVIAPLSPNRPASPPERTPPLGVVSGKPMSQFLLPPSVWGLPDKSDASGNGDWFASLAGIASQNPPQPASPPGAGRPVRYLVGQSQAPVADASAPAASVAPSNEPNFSGGLLSRLAALMGVDPENPTQLAPPPLDDQLRGFYRDDPLQPWFAQRQR